jgi:hypothetical protein
MFRANRVDNVQPDLGVTGDIFKLPFAQLPAPTLPVRRLGLRRGAFDPFLLRY